MAITVEELIELLRKHKSSSVVRFSVANDSSEDDGERWFVEDGIEDIFSNRTNYFTNDENEVTICLVAKSNLR